ncbi:MAG TPA: putative DNA-binding domain-containing protein [Minicystis sp.]|nr:putative DNA-binding domain-containing protein [Minicystis sp.]
MTRLDALLGVVDTAIRAPDEEAARARGDARGFLRAAGLDEADVEATAPAAGRLLLYRKLVRRGISAAIRQQVPRAAARLGPLFDELVTAFVTERAPRSRYLRDVAFEFVAFAAPRLAADARVAPFLVDLARHELSAFAAGSAPDAPAAARPEPELALDRPVLFDPSAHLARSDFAVHELAADVDARDEPRRAPTWLFAYRDATDEVRWLALSDVAGEVVARLLAGAALGAAVEAGAGAAAHAVDDALLASVAAVLTDLQARGALLGAAPETKP